MAVEILILSGARQGARLVLDGKQLRAGTEPDCEVFFDPQHDPSAKDRAALLQLEDDGWHIRSTGTGELIVNQQTIAGPKSLRSGDVVRLSPSGPGFCFRLMAPGAENPKKSPGSPGVPGVPPPAVAVQPEVKPPEAAGAPATAATAGPSAPAVPATAGQVFNLSGSPPMASFPASMVPTAPSPWIKWVLAGLGACLVLALLWRILQPPQFTIHLDAKSADSGRIDGNGLTTDPETSAPPRRTGEAFRGSAGTTDPGPPPNVTPPPAPPLNFLEQLRDTVFLLEVEKAGRFWPLATCVAVDKHTLLTSAGEAMKSADWRENYGFKNIWAVNARLGIKKEIREIRLHGMYVTLAAKPGGWIYFNLALLSVDGDLPAVAPLASREELDELDEGTVVCCLGFEHEGEKTAAHHQLEPKCFPGSIFMVTAAEDLQGQPRLLHVKAKIPGTSTEAFYSTSKAKWWASTAPRRRRPIETPRLRTGRSALFTMPAPSLPKPFVSGPRSGTRSCGCHPRH